MKEKSEFEESFGSLEDGLRAGFGRASRGSVLACLEERTGSILGLALPDVEADREPVVKPSGADKAGCLGARYQVLGEIARGGLGVVMKGRDLDLGRDVAVKILHERFKDDRRVLERFVEEAQIGGQLQHPGIVPVYELGLQADDRPFFAMKLVKGETLAAMLKRRRSPREDQQRFLRVFLQICQSVAYAHVRRVVHRDLKPSNVLVGAFGEVQVVDWGLAKVLRGGGVHDERERDRDVSVIETVRTAEGSSASLAGSIMGTPGYMSPEQARGEVEHMDARSDVFSLGAVLCEILSGAPPYDVEDRMQAVQDACECRYGPALRRLAESGADEEIVALCRACLAPSRGARPQDAGEVAARVEAHLQSVEDRARQAEVRAAELRVRTRSALVLAGLVVLVLVASAWTWAAWQAGVSERRGETERRANAAVVEATRFAGQAEQAGLGGVELWGKALAAARRAEEVVAAGDADPALEERVVAMVADVAAKEQRTREEQLREAAHALWLERALEVRVGPDVPRLDLFEGDQRREREATRRRREYQQLFGEVGLDQAVDAERAAELFDCEHRASFALVFDAWAEAERVAALYEQEPDSEAWRRPVRAARRLDPSDAWRNRLRSELERGTLDLDALRSLAETDALRDRSAEEVAIVVALLDAAGDARGAVEAQLTGLLLHPDDFWLNISLANLCSQEELLGRLHGADVERATRSALVLRPDSRRARLGFALDAAEPGGVVTLELLQGLRSELPDDPVLETLEFVFLMAAARYDEARARIPAILPALRATKFEWDYAHLLWSPEYVEALLEGPDVPPQARGLLLVRLGRYEEAWAVLEGRDEPLRPRWPWIYLPPLLEGIESADQLRAEVERLQSLVTADAATVRAASARELLAATELVPAGWDGLDASVTLFQRAFERDPAAKEIWTGTHARQFAAFTAALASGVGTADGEPLPPERRTALRRLALDWLHEELDVLEAGLTSPDATLETATNTSRVLHQMTVYAWLAPLREPEFVARMTPEEARECRVLWARIHALESMLVHLFAE